jgi:hypothetical protein
MDRIVGADIYFLVCGLWGYTFFSLLVSSITGMKDNNDKTTNGGFWIGERV